MPLVKKNGDTTYYSTVRKVDNSWQGYSVAYGKTIKYYKYQEQPFASPILSSNGVWGGNSFAVYRWNEYGGFEGYDAWGAFTNSTGTWTGNYRDEGWSCLYIDMYNPVPLRITGYSFFHNGGWGSEWGAIDSSQLYGSNDMASWTALGSGGGVGPDSTFSTTFTNNNYYTYHRLRTPSKGGGHTDYIKISLLRLTASTKIIVPGTLAEHDFVQEYGTSYI